MTLALALRGTVRDASTGAGPAGVVCLSRGGAFVAQATLQADGAFELQGQALESGRYDVLLLATGLEGWRRSIDLRGPDATDVQLGTIELQPSEFPPGIYGRAWDALMDRPVVAGRVRLEHAGAVIASERLEAGGMFSIEMTCARPLDPGEYELIVEAPGYRPGRLVVHMGAEPRAHQLGPVELESDGG